MRLEGNTSNKRNLSQTSDTGNHTRTKKRLTFQPAGSGSEADNESDNGHNMSATMKSILHSTVREDSATSSQQEGWDKKSIPETPDVPIIPPRYIAQSPKNTKLSSQPESESKPTIQQSEATSTNYGQ